MAFLYLFAGGCSVVGAVMLSLGMLYDALQGFPVPSAVVIWFFFFVLLATILLFAGSKLDELERIILEKQIEINKLKKESSS